MSLDPELLPKERCFQFLPTVQHIFAPVKFTAPLLKRATAKAPLYDHVFYDDFVTSTAYKYI